MGKAPIDCVVPGKLGCAAAGSNMDAAASRHAVTAGAAARTARALEINCPAPRGPRKRATCFRLEFAAQQVHDDLVVAAIV